MRLKAGQAMKNDEEADSIEERLAKADRAIQRAKVEEKIRELGGLIGRPIGESDEADETESSFLRYVMAWETGPFSSHGEWLARRGLVFDAPEDLRGRRLKKELWRLIESLAVARVFLYHTNHLSDAELYAQLWNEVLDGGGPDFARTPDDACHWDLADWSTGDEKDEQVWLRYHASEKERRQHELDFVGVVLPPRKRAPFRRDHRLPVRD